MLLYYALSDVSVLVQTAFKFKNKTLSRSVLKNNWLVKIQGTGSIIKAYEMDVCFTSGVKQMIFLVNTIHVTVVNVIMTVTV